ncbi:MAG: serine/threonine protein kinase, partial [Krumholzibacteria bacterium]|nr:serine/threonine protein kinase [Candidatus Krumholzibacteria bacterium]
MAPEPGHDETEAGDPRWQLLRELFAAAAGLATAARTALLDRETAGDPQLRAELEALLQADSRAGEFLAPASHGAATGTIGPYRLLQVLGEGGFGVVYLAEQIRPIRRHVALKLVKPGMDSRQVIARFEAERQTLASLDHPGIARVYDAGETPDGRPYFVMEYVQGLPVTTYCERSDLGLRERLGLFLRICDAVGHAHQAGVIHRDLKASNVLVAKRAGVPAPRVIDFGIAKATGPGADADTATIAGTVLGTLGAMSPEQAGAIAAKVDTRTDIYALGILLYELLAGAPPFDPVRLRGLTWLDALCVIRQEEPPPLSMRAATAAAPGDPLEVAPQGEA